MDKQTWLDLNLCITAAMNRSDDSGTIEAAERAEEWLMSQDVTDA